MHIAYTEEQEQLRDELRSYYDELLTDELREQLHQEMGCGPVTRQVVKQMAADGWLGIGWPKEYGGQGRSQLEQFIFFDESMRSGAPVPMLTINTVGPTIMEFGTDEQKAEFLPRILAGDLHFCIGYSEPEAGTDLAALKTRAVLDGDHFVVNGQKVWTSGAHHSDWNMCFVRTNPDVPKHKGISVLIIDMKTPGVEPRPFPELSDPDYTDFNEVFFTDVVVPKENLLGELDQGWALAGGSLAHERAMLWIENAYDCQRGVEELLGLGERIGPNGYALRDDPKFRSDVASLFVDAQAMRLMGVRGFSKFLKGKSAPEHSLLKLFGGETTQKILLAGTEALGAAALDDDAVGPRVHRRGSWITGYLRTFASTIPGGTSEIQRNIIAERVLGLPRG